jgi:hypothetical protein
VTRPPSTNPEDYADPVVTDTDGRVVVTWPDGRRLWVAATPELVQQWAATVNTARDERDAARAEVARLRSKISERNERHRAEVARTVAECARYRAALERIERRAHAAGSPCTEVRDIARKVLAGGS